MERPNIKDDRFQRKSHDCWGVTEWTFDSQEYIKALELYIDHLETQDERG